VIANKINETEVYVKSDPGENVRSGTYVHIDTIDTVNIHTQMPIPMLLICPSCSARHIDEDEFATKAHHTHACQSCGMVWRPAKINTVGVRFLPGYKNEK
jgi:rubredoxin